MEKNVGLNCEKLRQTMTEKLLLPNEKLNVPYWACFFPKL